MKKSDSINEVDDDIDSICNIAKEYIEHNNFDKCKGIICEAMKKYPNSPQPHNLMGILYENKGDHIMAMKHFRASCAIDPSYLPSRYNMEQYGDMFSKGRKSFYVEGDCPREYEKQLYKIEYDENGIGHIVKRN